MRVRNGVGGERWRARTAFYAGDEGVHCDSLACCWVCVCVCVRIYLLCLRVDTGGVSDKIYRRRRICSEVALSYVGSPKIYTG